MPWFQQTLMLDPRERCSVIDCLEHAAFETERLLHRNHTSASGRRNRRTPTSHDTEADGRNVSRPDSIIRSKTPSNIVTEIRLTPIPPDKAEVRSTSPDHGDDKRRGTPAGHDNPPSHSSIVRTSPDASRHNCDEQNVVQDVTTSRFIRKKPITVSKPADPEEISVDERAASVLPAVDDPAPRDRVSAAVSATNKTYSINVSGATVPVHRNKKTAAPVNTVGPLTERKSKVGTRHHYLNIQPNNK